MKKWSILLAGTAVAAIGVGVYFADDIRIINGMLGYKKMFDPENIAVSFRTMPDTLPSVTIPRGSEVYQLKERIRPAALPETYEYNGEIKPTRALFKKSNFTGMAILHNGELIYEAYDLGNTRETRAIQMSVSKSMVSFLVGVAHEEGAIENIEDQVVKYVPSLKGSAYDGATIKDVLEMSSGIRWNEDYSRLDSDITQSMIATQFGSLDEFSGQIPREFEPGTYNRYASADTHVLGMVVRHATGEEFADYFYDRLWSKLGAEDDAVWITDTVDEPVAYGGANIRVRDMLRFGELYLNGGVNFKGEQLVSEEWVQKSTRPDNDRLRPGNNNPQSGSGFGYKYQWWTPLEPDGHDFMALGIYGQMIYVNPARNVVIARTSAYKNFTTDDGHFFYENITAFQEIARYLTPDVVAVDGSIDRDLATQ